MKKKILSLLGLVLFFTFLFIPPVLSYTPAILYFRDIIPVQKSIESLTFTLPLVGVEKISFICDSPIEQSTGKIIPEQRITFSYQQQTVFSNQPLSLNTGLNTEAMTEKEISFLINIEFNPSDPPGEYEGKIYAVCQNSTGDSRRIPLMLKIKILPWIKLKSATPNPSLVINRLASFTETDLQPMEPVIIMIASNSSWLLYMNVRKEANSTTLFVPIEISVANSSKHESFREIFLPNDGYKMVAAGPPTVIGDGSGNNRYWTELALNASIPDCINYPSGNHAFNLYFSGRIAH
ncbi:MAG TPA: hypothetical protein DEB05_05750 [Firmicutes bacterium]|jgi:hypothetical protein|nr:hypothetical protein [Bacillota bacterium]HBT16444.1 hypothetical protein [Bacillota bacterium]